MKNEIGNIYGKLTVLERSEVKRKCSNGCIMWLCQCECGNKAIVSGDDLRRGRRIDCGMHKQISLGEKTILNLLIENNFNFISHWHDYNCYFEDTARPAIFDFKIILDNLFYYIEFDGLEHFMKNKLYDIKKIQERDKIKNNYCFNNNIPLIRIPFIYENNIKLEDLILDSSPFVFTKEKYESLERFDTNYFYKFYYY